MPTLDDGQPGAQPGAHDSARDGARALDLDAAIELTRTGDVWIFRGQSNHDRAIRLLTNAPVNHVGMAVALSDLPTLMWHAELGQSLIDVWTGEHHRGAQLHDLREAVLRWTHVYGQEAFLRQLHPMVERDHEDALLRSIARYNGISFPRTAQMAWRWTKGRGGPIAWLPERPQLKEGARSAWQALTRWPFDPPPEPTSEAAATTAAAAAAAAAAADQTTVRPETAYCAEVVAMTYEDMGILERGRPASWYDPGRFWSGDALPLVPGWVFGAEIRIAVDPPASQTRRSRSRSTGRRRPR